MKEINQVLSRCKHNHQQFVENIQQTHPLTGECMETRNRMLQRGRELAAENPNHKVDMELFRLSIQQYAFEKARKISQEQQ